MINTTEKAFEDIIEKYLIEKNGFIGGNPKDFNTQSMQQMRRDFLAQFFREFSKRGVRKAKKR